MYRVAIRYMGRDKDDTITASVAEEAATKFRAEFADPKNMSAFVTVEAQDKSIILRRDSIVCITIALDNRDR